MVPLLLAVALAAAPAPSCLAPDGTRIVLELAISDQERERGLMYRDLLAANSGMLFLFAGDEAWPFWMKNTFIPLDLVWLDPAGTVVDVRAAVQPCRSDPCPSYRPVAKARAVLEVNAGFASAHGITRGSVLRCEGVSGYPVAGGGR